MTDLEQELEGPLELLVDLVLVVGVVAAVLVLGAKLERRLMKQQLEVVDGGDQVPEVEAAGGDRR